MILSDTVKGKQFYQKRYLELAPRLENDAIGDRERILEALRPEYGEVSMSYEALRQIYPLCREAGWRITAALAWCRSGWEVIRVEPGDTSAKCFALAVDYGSTTITMELVELISGETIASDTLFNPQIAYGDEILSRILYTKDNPAHLREIQEKSWEGLSALIANCQRKSGISGHEYLGMVIAGNTTMVHLLLGLSPWTVFHTPYAPVATEYGQIRAAELGVPLPGYVYFMPAAANYLGGDIMSGLLCTRIDQEEEISLFLDIGTNGELVIGNKDYLIAGAGAAGPALESGASRFGMRAEDGAVNHVSIAQGQLRLQTIGGLKPRGICGSGIVELIAELFLNGWIDFRGVFVPEKSERILEVPGENEPEFAVCYAWRDESAAGEELVFTQGDINRFIQAKAAAHTMVATLLEYTGIDPSAISRFYQAGAFGTYADLESAITIGLYPDLPRNVFKPLGNASLQGAKILLIDYRQMQRLEAFVRNIAYVQFGEVANFVENMRAAAFLPHTRQENYPSVIEKLRSHKENAAGY